MTFQTLGPMHPMPQHHIPDDLNHHEDVKLTGYVRPCLHSVWFCNHKWNMIMVKLTTDEIHVAANWRLRHIVPTMNRWLLIQNYNQYTTQLTVPSYSSLCLLPHLNNYMVILIWVNIQALIPMYIFSNASSTLHSCMPHNIISSHQGSKSKLTHTNLLNANCSLHTRVYVYVCQR
jgi:hypothetical protein